MDAWAVHGGHCYHGSRDTLPWFSAGAQCRLNAAALPTNISFTEQTFLTAYLNTHVNGQSQYYWIGLTNTKQGEWKWVDSKLLEKSFLSLDPLNGLLARCGATSDILVAGDWK